MELGLTNILIIMVFTLVMTTITAIILINRKKSSYDVVNKKAVLDDVRNSLERQIYMLNDRLIQSEERWKDVNHLLLKNEYQTYTSIITNNRRTYYSEFLKANGIKESDLNIDRRLIFILTPFNDSFYEDYKVIRETCTNLGFKCFRGDENFIKGDIFPEMLKLIVKANFIIANINGRNSNVLYELGIAQAIDKPVLLVSKKPEDLPVDVKSKKFLIYSNYKELAEMIKAEINNMK